MAHEITKTDNVLLHTNKAWHGLGQVVDQDLTPRQALTACGLEWGVQQEPIYRYVTGDDGERKLVEIDSHQVNVRADNEAMLGLVSKGYHPIQNVDLADFSEQLADIDKDVTVETCGSIQGGKKVWFLCRSHSFSIGPAGNDEIVPYLCVSNGHDGGASLRVTPTSVRVVCSNTLHMVIPRMDDSSRSFSESGIALRHTKNVMERIDEVKQALQRFNATQEYTRDVAQDLAKKHIRTQNLEQFFAECWQRDFQPIPTNPQDKKEERRKRKAADAFNTFTQRFDDEIEVSGASWWTAMNAYTGMLQHDMKSRGSDDQARVENRVYSNLFGLNAKRSLQALETAFEMAS